MMLTDPGQARDFVARTGVDALAIAIGTSHGAYKFTRQPTGDILAIERIAAIHAAVPDTHLVMHGSSSVPQEWLAVIRQYGGDIKETYGVPVEEIQRGIESGVRKINIDTDIRLAMTGAMRQVFSEQPSEFDPRKALIAARQAARGICKLRFEAFGCAGPARRAEKRVDETNERAGLLARERIIDRLTVPPRRDEPVVAQPRELLGKRRLAYAEQRFELAHASLRVDEIAQYEQTVLVRYALEKAACALRALRKQRLVHSLCHRTLTSCVRSGRTYAMAQS
jgi:hypothetical protein